MNECVHATQKKRENDAVESVYLQFKRLLLQTFCPNERRHVNMSSLSKTI